MKYYRIDLSILGPTGLFNQLINLINGLIIGHLTQRVIYHPRFLPNYNSLDSIPLEEILDLVHLNQLLSSLNLNTSIEFNKTVDEKEWVISKYYNKLTNPLTTNSLDEICSKLFQEDSPYLNIGSVFGLLSTNDLEDVLFGQIRFLPKYYEVLNHCLTYFNSKYNTIHLRLEDDWINFISESSRISFEDYTQKLFNDYLLSMEKIFSPNDTIFLATHLLKSNNRNNHLIDRIRITYPNLVYSIPWRDNFPDFLPGREIDAIIDYLIGINGERFIGLYFSTYSRIIGRIYRLNGKVYHIIS